MNESTPPASPATAVSAAGARLAVVGTAGHIDHGKTALVRRLTGVDTDRLPEEKKRGISIDLGFAPLVTPSGVRVGLVDVPGHERFVKNMLAGVGGIDLVLLVIAADEGVMPQTLEHLAIVRLLGVPRAIVVLTKSDLVERAWLDEIAADVRRVLAGGAYADAPIVEFSATTGAGRDALLAELDRQLAGAPERGSREPARLPVDRVFTVEGFGTVVTGTLWRGAIRTGETLALLPAGHAVRVRRVQVHGATVGEALAGQRTALALHGVERDQVTRGDWLVAPDSLRPSAILDVRFELLAEPPRPWPGNTRVRFHLGASEIIGRLVTLDGAAIAPGKSALAQVRLEQPTVAARGDRFVIRQYSPSRTIGGGSVIEPVAAKRRRHGAGLEALAVHESGSLEARLLERLRGEPHPVSTAALAQGAGESEAATRAALEALLGGGDVVEPRDGRWLSVERWEAARERIAGEVAAFAESHPARFGVMKGELKSGLKSALEAPLFDVAFEALEREGALEVRGERVRPAGVPWSPPPAMLEALERVTRDLEAAGMQVPDAPAWQASLGKGAAEIVALGTFLGRLVRVSQDLTYTGAQMESLRAKLVAWFAAHPTLNVAALRDLAGVSRKFAVPLLEHTDRMGWTVRVGDERKAGGRLGGDRV
ncbi:MAG TPA: selenocysteine-specific translation elongation factor [Candidatus Saccharimonadaceae bacterium]|jgi:selenocysteine-specific elongation factor|nr:selenocysteine-specific translation elongation factor [Candidatus Saccharimonadaceae bacterium]